MRFHALWPMSQTRLFPNSRGTGFDGEEVIQRKGGGGGGVMRIDGLWGMGCGGGAFSYDI
jgi:hypothetical protein